MVMASTQGADIMANLAARLMSSSVASCEPKKSAAASKVTAPLSNPSPQLAETLELRSVTPSAPTKSLVSAARLNAGPSLFGSTEQLEAARQFAVSATQSGSKSRGGRRQRMLSAETTRARQPLSRESNGIHTSTTISGRSTATMVTAAKGHTLSVPSPCQRPCTMNPKQKIETKPSPQKPLPTASANGLTSPKPPAGQRATKGELVPASHTMTKSKTGDAMSTDPIVSKAVPWQLKDATNTLQDCASHVLYPHMRGTPRPKVDKTNSSHEALAQFRLQASATASLSTSTILSEATESSLSTDTSAKSERVNGRDSGKPSQVGQKPLSNSTVASPMIVDEGTSNMHVRLKAVLVAANVRICSLEEEMSALQKRVEAIFLAEERRKFLGTDDAMAPYGLKIKGPNGNVVPVQATAAIKVGELIRRIRVKANLPNGNNPRVSLDEQQLGHGMTLGEAGVTQHSILLFAADSSR